MSTPGIVRRLLKTAPTPKRAKCQYCGKTFKPARHHQKYHSPVCRFRAFEKRQAERLEKQIAEEITQQVRAQMAREKAS